MAPRRRRAKRRAEITPEQEAWLRGDYENASFVNYLNDEPLGELWNRYSESLVEVHAAEQPGTRPGRWWKYTAPEMRKRLGGTGTPCHEVLEGYWQRYQHGIPVDFITEWQVQLYADPLPQGQFHCKPILPFKGVAIDPKDPPIFESQAAYLKRLGLLLEGEKKHLKKSDFEVENVC